MFEVIYHQTNKELLLLVLQIKYVWNSFIKYLLGLLEIIVLKIGNKIFRRCFLPVGGFVQILFYATVNFIFTT